jgi:Mitochondrial carrier protein
MGELRWAAKAMFFCEERRLSFFILVSSSVLLVVSCSNTPVDVIKTRMQGLEASKYKNVVDCARQIAQQEGLKGFYKGATARLARVCLDVTVVVLYEQISKVLDKVWKD